MSALTDIQDARILQRVNEIEASRRHSFYFDSYSQGMQHDRDINAKKLDVLSGHSAWNVLSAIKSGQNERIERERAQEKLSFDLNRVRNNPNQLGALMALIPAINAQIASLDRAGVTSLLPARAALFDAVYRITGFVADAQPILETAE